jgi:peroxiredoxin Q/BCP
LSNYQGQWVLIYFYPKDDTPGCTTEACELRDRIEELNNLKLQVFGISKDDVKSHRKFADKYHLTFPLLADTEKTVMQLYDVWGERSFMGKKYMGVSRSSYLIDPKGTIVKIYEKVQPKDHAKEVADDVARLSQ